MSYKILFSYYEVLALKLAPLTMRYVLFIEKEKLYDKV